MKGFDLLAILLNPEFGEMLLHGVQLTLVVAAGSWLLAMTLALVLLVVRLTPSRIAAARASQAYVSYHRNVPTLVQLMLWYFGIASLLPRRAAGAGCPSTTPRRCSPSSRSGCARPRTSAKTCAPACAPIPRGPGRGRARAGPRLHRLDAPRADAAGACATRSPRW